MSDGVEVVIGAAVVGMSSKIAEMLAGASGVWLRKYFSAHHPAAVASAEENTADFMAKLATRVGQLEEQGRIDAGQAAAAQQSPAFARTLEQAFLTACETDNAGKHDLLSRIVAELLISEGQSTFALASRAAVRSVEQLTPRQLRALGFLSVLILARPTRVLDSAGAELWCEININPYEGLRITDIDLINLEAASCLHTNPALARDLIPQISGKFGGWPGAGAWVQSRPSDWLRMLWMQPGVSSVDLTSIGLILGNLVTDQLTGQTTDLTHLDA